MKKLLLTLITFGILNAQTPAELADFTAQISLRNVFSGDLVTLREDRSTWKIRDVFLPNDVARKDTIGNLFRLTPVQFVDKVNDNVCLAITPGERPKPKTCFEDVNNRQFETVFTIIPVSTTAIQIRAFGQGSGNLCLSYSDANSSDMRPFELTKCNFDGAAQIDMHQLFMILPPMEESRIISQ